MFPSLNGVDLTAGRAANGDRCGMIALVWGERGAAWELSWRPRPYRPSGKGHAAPVPADLNQRPSAPRGSVPITSDQSASQGQNRFIESQWSRPVPPGRSLSAGMLPGSPFSVSARSATSSATWLRAPGRAGEPEQQQRTIALPLKTLARVRRHSFCLPLKSVHDPWKNDPAQISTSDSDP